MQAAAVLGALIGILVGLLTNSEILGIITAVISIIVLYLVIHNIHVGAGKGMNKLGDALTQKFVDKNKQKSQSQGSVNNVPLSQMYSQSAPAAETDDSAPTFCSQCGSPVEKDSSFCTNCGNKLE